MAAIRLMLCVVLLIVQSLPMVGDEPDDATREQMQEREAFLNEKMAQMLQELEQSAFAWRALLWAALQQWQFWAIAGGLMVLFGLCWWLRKRSRQPASNREDGFVALDVGRVSARVVLDLLLRRTMEGDLVDELLRICRHSCRNNFMPELMVALRVTGALQGRRPRHNVAVHHLLVVMNPPLGHAFHLELGTAEEMPARNSRLRVELECTCMREQLLEDMLCFLHHPEEELRRNQAASLLQTLCTGPYLDIQKTILWFQTWVEAAWVRLPQAQRLFLTVLPSRDSCKLRLTNNSDYTCLIEMFLGVRQGDSDTFLSIEEAEAV